QANGKPQRLLLCMREAMKEIWLTVKTASEEDPNCMKISKQTSFAGDLESKYRPKALCRISVMHKFQSQFRRTLTPDPKASNVAAKASEKLGVGPSQVGPSQVGPSQVGPSHVAV